MTRLWSEFETWAGDYDASVLQSLLFEPVHAAVVDQLRLYAPHAARVLDVGCGTGRLIASIACMYPMLVGVDPAAQMLRVARRQLRGASLVCGRAEGLPIASGAFDVVTSTLSLRHWQEPSRGIRELARVLAPDGVMVVAEAENGLRPAQWRCRLAMGPRRTRLGQLLASGDLEVVDHRLASVRGPIPDVHVVTARRRPPRHVEG